MTTLSISTNYMASAGSAKPYLRRIAEAGFSHIHWCHHWGTDFLYSRWEIGQIKEWLSDFGLRLLATHGSDGLEKRWTSALEYERLSGIDLVKNRIEMTAELSADVVVMHCGVEAEDPEKKDSHIAILRRSLDELEPFARDYRVRIAMENGSLEMVRDLVSEYSPDYLGVCFDSGHSNIHRDMEVLESLKDRLISIHLHDNDGMSDQHRPLFDGTVDWTLLAAVIAGSSYRECINLEVSMHGPELEDESVFLRRVFEEGLKFSAMIKDRRGG